MPYKTTIETMRRLSPVCFIIRAMSRTQSFPKLMRHLDKSRHLILLSQPYSQCLACQAKMLTTRKLQKVQQVTFKEWKLLLLKGSFISAFGNSIGWLVRILGGFWVVPWLNEGLIYFQAPMELSGTLEGSFQFKYILKCPTSFQVQAYVQKYTRDLWNSLEGCGLLSCLPPQCRVVWIPPGISRTFHTLPTLGVSISFLALYKPMGRLI